MSMFLDWVNRWCWVFICWECLLRKWWCYFFICRSSWWNWRKVGGYLRIVWLKKIRELLGWTSRGRYSTLSLNKWIFTFITSEDINIVVYFAHGMAPAWAWSFCFWRCFYLFPTGHCFLKYYKQVLDNNVLINRLSI